MCGFYNLPDINFFLPIFCVCIKKMLYATFYAICVYECIFFDFCFSKQHLMGVGMTEASGRIGASFCPSRQYFQCASLQ